MTVNSIDVAREMLRLFEADVPEDEILPALRRTFPSATIPELMHALAVCHDQVRMWRETVNDDLAESRQMLLNGVKNRSMAELLEAKACFDEAKAKSATIWPTKPDKSRS